MALRRLTRDERCKDGFTCPGVWEEEQRPEGVVVVGELLEPSPVPLGPGERAVRLPRQVLRDADLG
ncbi:MAG: hypothetical protein M3O70_13415 [Actinomycetota bacterium]|nr:hypothetical protein [Actinomycetota bacterium]